VVLSNKCMMGLDFCVKVIASTLGTRDKICLVLLFVIMFNTFHAICRYLLMAWMCEITT